MPADVPPSSSVPTSPRPEGGAPSFAQRLAAAPWVVSTYFAEGLPYSVVRSLSSEFFTSFGVSPRKIGATSLYGVAWNLKFLWSPFVERYGSLRRWLLVLQALIGLLVMGVAWPAGRGDLSGVARDRKSVV